MVARPKPPSAGLRGRGAQTPLQRSSSLSFQTAAGTESLSHSFAGFPLTVCGRGFLSSDPGLGCCSFSKEPHRAPCAGPRAPAGGGRAPGHSAAGTAPGSPVLGSAGPPVPRPSPYCIGSLIDTQERRPRHDLIINGAAPARRASSPPSPGEGLPPGPLQPEPGKPSRRKAGRRAGAGAGAAGCAGEVRSPGPSGE